MLVCKRCSPSDWRFCVATFSQNHSAGERGGYKKGGGLVDSGDLAPCKRFVSFPMAVFAVKNSMLLCNNCGCFLTAIFDFTSSTFFA